MFLANSLQVSLSTRWECNLSLCYNFSLIWFLRFGDPKGLGLIGVSVTSPPDHIVHAVRPSLLAIAKVLHFRCETSPYVIKVTVRCATNKYLPKFTPKVPFLIVLLNQRPINCGNRLCMNLGIVEWEKEISFAIDGLFFLCLSFSMLEPSSSLSLGESQGRRRRLSSKCRARLATV